MSAPHVPRHHHVTTTARTPGQRWPAGWVGLSLLLACVVVFSLWASLAAPGSGYARIADLERRVTAIETELAP